MTILGFLADNRFNRRITESSCLTLNLSFHINVINILLHRSIAMSVSAQMVLQDHSAEKTSMTANPIRVKIMALAQILCQITPVLVRWVSRAFTVNNASTTVKSPTVPKTGSALIIVKVFTAAVAVDISGNTANLKLTSAYQGHVSMMQPAMMLSTVSPVLAPMGLQESFVTAT